MWSKNLLIVFTKNNLLGKVKTRLAKAIGDYGAFEVYKELMAITETETDKLEDCDLHIYFSEVIVESKWPGRTKFLQVGDNLGERMQQAFTCGFSMGYRNVVGIGSDLPDLNVHVLLEAFQALNEVDTVFGPSRDGGYYLLGMNRLIGCVFENKPWSTEGLLQETLKELKAKGDSTTLLIELNDIDTIQDLKSSSVSDKFRKFYELS